MVTSNLDTQRTGGSPISTQKGNLKAGRRIAGPKVKGQFKKVTSNVTSSSTQNVGWHGAVPKKQSALYKGILKRNLNLGPPPTKKKGILKRHLHLGRASRNTRRFSGVTLKCNL